ncbi:MAG: NAD-dependent epimerase/dehydratase family protein [Acutalibacteraceae bacterium]|nr:NAD-dependent epimerase/dehydratase family protein [Acutalibacteraceae bacterium]
MVTGATGLIGSLIIKGFICHNEHYASKIKVIALARNPEKVKEIYRDYESDNGEIPYVDFYYQDICAPISDSIKCDYIIHTANSTTSKYFITNPVDVIESIYTGTKRILEYAVKNDSKGVVYLSSMEVFGRVSTENRINEQELGYIDIQNVRSCYSEGKRLAECLCKSYASQYGVPVKVARLAQTFGAGVLPTENRVFAQFLKSALKGENIVLHTKGLSVGNYCYTADAIRAILLLLNSGENGEAYTVVNEETTMTIADMAKLVADNFSGGSSKVVFDIPESNSFGYAPDTKMRLSAQKLCDLGWRPTVSLSEMYKRMIPDLKGE